MLQMTLKQLARDTGLAREGLYKALSNEGNPEFATVMKVIKALGLKLSVQPAHI
jgi:probable addiction module antidote protein